MSVILRLISLSVLLQGVRRQWSFRRTIPILLEPHDRERLPAHLPSPQVPKRSRPAPRQPALLPSPFPRRLAERPRRAVLQDRRGVRRHGRPRLAAARGIENTRQRIAESFPPFFRRCRESPSTPRESYRPISLCWRRHGLR